MVRVYLQAGGEVLGQTRAGARHPLGGHGGLVHDVDRHAMDIGRRGERWKRYELLLTDLVEFVRDHRPRNPLTGDATELARSDDITPFVVESPER